MTKLSLSLLLVPILAAASPAKTRRFSFTYEMRMDPVARGEGPVDLFVPIAQSDERQEIVSYRVEASLPGREGFDERYHNRFWHGHLDRSDGRDIHVLVTYEVVRTHFENRAFERATRNDYTAKEKRNLALYLRPNRLVPISGEIVDPIAKDIAPNEKSLHKIARATYDYVVDHMEYKKVGTGWGNGDTHWACSARYGNCTDFHALFSSLARKRGIPARFEIGFPVPEDRAAGDVQGYHCWVAFYLPDLGWVPIDASEAKKHPEQRELFFGTQPTDRIGFTVGRDLELGPGHTTGALNYFVYPHVEVGKKEVSGDKLRLRFAYRNLPTSDARLAH